MTVTKRPMPPLDAELHEWMRTEAFNHRTTIAALQAEAVRLLRDVRTPTENSKVPTRRQAKPAAVSA